MKYERFEDLPVWKAAMELAVRVYILTRDKFFSQPGDLRDQLRRSSLSISNNIAEGFERGTTAELIYFLYVARGSAGETRSMLIFIQRLNPPAHFRQEVAELKDLAESCSRQIRGWTDNLQNSEIPGQRRLTDQTRQLYEAHKRRDAFEKHLEQIVRKAPFKNFPTDE